MAGATSGKSAKSDKLAYIVVAIVGICGTGLIALWAIVQFGHVEGDEFSPDTLVRRTYEYHQIPWLRVQITGIDRVDTSGDLVQHLKTAKIVTPRNQQSPQWHTIQATAHGMELPPGDAAILFRYLDASTAPAGQDWLTWTNNHTPEAGVLWPVVAQLARDQLYLHVPELLVLAEDTSNLAQFTSRVNAYAADRYTLSAEIRFQMGDPTQAAQFYTTALSYVADHAKAIRGLAAVKAAPPAEATDPAAPSE